MKNGLIFGVSGKIASNVIDILSEKKEIHLILLLRNASRLRNKLETKYTIIESNALNLDDLREAMKDIDIVYGKLTGDLG